jgi:hypothetical protein
VDRAWVSPGLVDVWNAFGVAGGYVFTARRRGGRDANSPPRMPMFLSALRRLDFPTLGMPTTRTFSSGASGCCLAVSAAVSSAPRYSPRRSYVWGHTYEELVQRLHVGGPVPRRIKRTLVGELGCHRATERLALGGHSVG